MMVCSKRGPTIALLRGCWLRLHIPARFGACITRFSSASATVSCSGWSWLPWDDTGRELVAETVGGVGFGLGLLAGTGLSVVVL